MRYISLAGIFLIALSASAEGSRRAPVSEIVCSTENNPGIPSEIVLYDINSVRQRSLTADLIFFNFMPSWTTGNQILFSSNRDGGGAQKIWRIDFGGGGITQITSGGADIDYAMEMNRARTKIAFTRIVGGSAVANVWTMNPDGTGQVQLTNTTDRPGKNDWSLRPSWTPDGSQIFFASTENSHNGDSQIWRMSADGSEKTQITFGQGGNYPDANVPDVSADGKRVTFWSGEEGTFGEVWVMDINGGNVHQLTETPDPGSSDGPHFVNWSNHRIVYTRRFIGQSHPDTWIVDADTKETRLLGAGMSICD